MYAWNLIYIVYDSDCYVQVGSVDEESTKSDEEYDDLAMEDEHEKGYWSGDDEEFKDKVASLSEGLSTNASVDKYGRNLDLFERTRTEYASETLCSYSSLLAEKKERRMPSSNMKMRRRSLSIPAALRKHGSFRNDPILSGAPQS